jgi:hypothetical protein
MKILLLIALMFVAPIVAGIVFGFIQLGVYRLLGRPAEQTPSFPLLFARGLLAFFVLAAVLAVVTRSLSP